MEHSHKPIHIEKNKAHLSKLNKTTNIHTRDEEYRYKNYITFYKDYENGIPYKYTENTIIIG